MAHIILQNDSFSFEQVLREGIKLCKDTTHNNSFALAQQWLRGDLHFKFTTSGSTGIPKKITLHRSQLESSASGTIQALNLTNTEHLLVCMNTAFIGGAMLLIRGLLLNATITLQTPSANPLQQMNEDHPYTFVSFAPMQVYDAVKNLNNEQSKLSRFRHILIGGGAIDLGLHHLLSSLPTSVYHTYGMTETVSHIALKKLGTDSFFKTLPNVFIQTDERNCLAIKSESTNNEWVYTNDIVRLVDTHSFEVLGRFDDIINTGGVKVMPKKVEDAIRTILQNQLSNLIVMGLPDARLGNKIIAIIESVENPEILEHKLAQHLPSYLDKYEIPKLIKVTPRLVYTPTGKPDKVKTLIANKLQ